MDLLSQSLSPASPRAPERAGARRALARAGYWLPVAIPLGLFAQLGLLGLRPALAERRHLERMQAQMQQRFEADQTLNEELELRRAAREDPVFVERQRRLRALSWTAR